MYAGKESWGGESEGGERREGKGRQGVGCVQEECREKRAGRGAVCRKGGRVTGGAGDRDGNLL